MAEPAKKAAVPPSDSTTAPSKPRADFLGIAVFGLVTINLIAIGGMGYFTQKLWDRVSELQAQTIKLGTKEKVEENHIGKELQPQQMGTLYPLESFLVNISSDQGTKFLQTQMELELSDPALEDELVRKKPAVRDAIIVMLSSRSYKELREASGMKKLRQDLIRVINNLMSTGKVKEIYFTQFHFN